MKTWKMRGPGGEIMETVAPSAAKARANFRYRLVRDSGMSWIQAREFDMSDLAEVPR